VEEYIKEALSRQKRGAESARLLRRDFLPLFGSKPAIQLTRRELEFQRIQDSNPFEVGLLQATGQGARRLHQRDAGEGDLAHPHRQGRARKRLLETHAALLDFMKLADVEPEDAD
jgi:hypothetical protein